MRILVSGFLAFALWSAISTYIYVCKIKGLCYEPISMQNNSTSSTVDSITDVLKTNPVPLRIAKPENLTIYFAFDKSTFNSDASSDMYFSVSDSFLIQNVNAKISIIGHTDAIGSDEYNQALGLRRARRMQEYFQSKGITSDKIVITSKGEKDPVSDNLTSAGRATNRRAVITINK